MGVEREAALHRDLVEKVYKATVISEPKPSVDASLEQCSQVDQVGDLALLVSSKDRHISSKPPMTQDTLIGF